MKPILFNTQMVKAILEDRKTVTRRVVKPQPQGQPYRMGNSSCWPGRFADSKSANVYKPPYQPGDVLYVRETWGNYSVDNPESNAAYYLYRADYSDDAKGYWYEPEHIHFCDFPRWRPSIHMPKEAARIFLRVTDVFPEPLKSIRYFDCLAEGIPYRQMENDIIRDFAELWDSTIKPADRATYSFEANPWVWVNKFERISRKEAGCDA